MKYDNDDKALIMLSFDTGSARRVARMKSVARPSQLFRDYSHADAVIEAMEQSGIRAIGYNSDEYPDHLRSLLADPPVVLYCRGDASLLADESRNMAVVGTRTITRYGKDVTTQFVRAFAYEGLCVVSGGARGVDTVAHKTALECGGKTVAVLGCGVDVAYPPENKELLNEIAQNGLVVSEYPPGTPPHQFRFPERNRLISAFSSGVLVTEAGLKSGSLITADLAIEQGKELYVVPGSVFSKQSEGCNAKIKECQAAAVTVPEDILGAVARKDDNELGVQLSLEQSRIVEILSKEESMHFSELLESSGLSTGELSALLSEMEIYGMVNKLGGNYYQVARRL